MIQIAPDKQIDVILLAELIEEFLHFAVSTDVDDNLKNFYLWLVKYKIRSFEAGKKRSYDPI